MSGKKSDILKKGPLLAEGPFHLLSNSIKLESPINTKHQSSVININIRSI
jgi:hypothetical protein